MSRGWIWRESATFFLPRQSTVEMTNANVDKDHDRRAVKTFTLLICYTFIHVWRHKHMCVCVEKTKRATFSRTRRATFTLLFLSPTVRDGYLSCRSLRYWLPGFRFREPSLKSYCQLFFFPTSHWWWSIRKKETHPGTQKTSASDWRWCDADDHARASLFLTAHTRVTVNGDFHFRWSACPSTLGISTVDFRTRLDNLFHANG